MTEIIKIKIKLVTHITEMMQQHGDRWDRRIGLVYFQYIPSGGYITRVVTKDTDGPWLTEQVKKKLIYVQEEKTAAELR